MFRCVYAHTCVYVHVHAHRCMNVSVDVCKSQRCLIPLELEYQVGLSHQMWVLGAKLGASERATCSLNLQAIMLASGLKLFIITYIPIISISSIVNWILNGYC